jgi:branched-chain amino acid transport system substrate-binding protein
MLTRKRQRISGAALLSLLLLSACAPGQQGSEPEEPAATAGSEAAGSEAPGSEADVAADLPDEIVVGATLPLTGEESRIGGFYKEGYELAFELENEDGGLEVGDQTVPIRLELLDDTTNQATAVSLAERLITQNGVNALLGTYSTSLVEAQSTAAEQNQIPYVNGGGAATSIYARGYQWVFGNLAPIELLAETEMTWIEEQQEAGNLPTPAKIAVVWENTSHGKDFQKGITDFVEASEGDYEIVVDESFELNGRDFSALLSEVRASGADLFMVDAHLPDYITMQRQYTTAGMCHDVITYGARGPEADAREALGDEGVAYILSAVWWNAQLGAEGINKEFVDAFTAKYDKEPEWYHAVSYEAARALFTAILEAGSVEPEAVRDALAALEMESLLPGGTLTFPEETGFQAQYPFVVQQNTPEGESPIIYPEDAATGEGVAPNPNCAEG